MPLTSLKHDLSSDAAISVLCDDVIESGLISKLQSLKYEYRLVITNRATPVKNFRENFEALNRVWVTDVEFARLLDEIVIANVFTASKPLSSINSVKCIDDDDSNSFVRQTTCSGKTLNSFKAPSSFRSKIPMVAIKKKTGQKYS